MNDEVMGVVEEEDELVVGECSENTTTTNPTTPIVKHGVSFREAVMKSSQWFNEARKIMVNSNEWEEEDEDVSTHVHAIKFPKEKIRELRKPWSLTLIGKCLGLKVRTEFITSREKRKLWENLKEDIPPSLTPRLVMGDMNEVLSQNEKMGGRPVANSQGAHFSEWVDAAGLIDLGSNGPKFTWDNGREGIDLIRERLDRALSNAEWLRAYPNTQISSEDLSFLSNGVSVLEIRNALFSMAPIKCPGPDGIQHIFFQEHWNVLILSCITTPSISILWNGEITEEFTPSRGIRQGNPLSSYIFVLCLERLSLMIEHKFSLGLWSPIKIDKDINISHLFYADDVFLFAKASVDNVEVIKETLAEFGDKSGLYISPTKSKVIFPPKMSLALKSVILEVSNIKGAPSFDYAMDIGFNYRTFFNIEWEGWINYNLNQNTSWKTMFGVALWHIWKARNTAVFQLAMTHPITMFNRYMVDLVATIKTFQGQGKTANIQQEKARVAAGGVVRDSDGRWIFGKSWKTKARTPAEADLLAMRGGMQMVIDAGFHYTVLETDAKSLKATIEDVGKHGTHELAVNLNDMQELLNKGCDFQFSYVKRDANEVAHYLARMAMEMDDLMIIHGDPPHCAKEVYEIDLQNDAA
uniref:Uncharacterized protein n=1 Tax=Chenopodium quinoa TaxID=63459 RepID=A0A803LLL4_CHEQI